MVISSDWRRQINDIVLVRHLEPTLGLQFLAVVEYVESSRANEIIADTAGWGLTKWFALVDYATALTASKKECQFIYRELDTGLSESVVQELLRKQLRKNHKC